MFAPQVSEKLISRSTLINKLDQARAASLLLVSGAAGYGKSTTIAIRGFVTAEQEVTDPFSGLFVALFGFYYMNNDALQYFEDAPERISNFRIKINNLS